MPKYRKAISTALCALLLAGTLPVHAEYVSYDAMCAEAAGGWHETYAVGDQTVVIDLGEHTILLPEAERVPVVTVRAGDPAPDETLSGFTVTENSARVINYSYGSWRRNNVTGKNLVSYPYPPSTNDLFLPPDIATVDWSLHAERNPLSLGEARDMGYREIARCTDAEFAATFVPCIISTVGALYEYDAKADTYTVCEHEDNMGAYTVQFSQTLDGIPILATCMGSFELPIANETGYIHASADIAVYDDVGFATGLSYVKVLENKYDDIPVASFAEIKGILEELIAESRVRGIDYMEFGYVLFRDKSRQDMNWAVPTWQIRGDIYEDAEQEPYKQENTKTKEIVYIPRKGAIFITAQGQFIDPMSIKRDRSICPPIIGWNKVK